MKFCIKWGQRNKELEVYVASRENLNILFVFSFK